MDDLELVVTTRTLEKLEDKHHVSLLEVEEAFFNMEGVPLLDNRDANRTIPPTVWFISITVEGRLLKLVGIPFSNRKEFVLKTAYEPSYEEVKLYENNQ